MLKEIGKYSMKFDCNWLYFLVVWQAESRSLYIPTMADI